MRLLLSWVRDFVDVTASADAVAEALGLRGFEVAEIERLGAGDAVIDFEVTANRPDCLSVLGFAREIGTVYGLPVQVPSAAPGSKTALAPIESGESSRVKVTRTPSMPGCSFHFGSSAACFGSGIVTRPMTRKRSG